MSLARRHQTYREAVAISRDHDMRADILRIAAMKATIRLMASVGPVGEADIADRYGLSKIEAFRLLNGMVADGQIRAQARKPPYWLEHFNARESEPIGSTNWLERFSEPFWNYFESLSWATYRLPEKLHAITAKSRRSSVFYGTEQSERLRKEFWRVWRQGTIKAFIRGTEVLPAAALDPRIIEDADLVFEAVTLKAKWRPSVDVLIDGRSLLTSQDNPPLRDKKEVVLDPLTRSKLKAICAFLRRGDRPKGEYKTSFPKPKGSVSRMDEFAYRVQLEVLSDRRDRHNAEVNKRRAAKVDRETAIVKNGAIPSDVLVTSKLQPQAREFETGFDAGRIRHLLLDLEQNKHPWLVEGTEIGRLLNSLGNPPPDIDNDLCEALSSDIQHGCD
jgi:hypothetical protein